MYDDATGVNPSYTWYSSGVTTVGLRVTDDMGASDTDTAFLDLESIPVADAGPDQDDMFYGDTICFDASGSCDPDDDSLTYYWDFNNDGNYDVVTGDSCVSHVFSGQGYNAQTVVLKVMDGDDNFDIDTMDVKLDEKKLELWIYDRSVIVGEMIEVIVKDTHGNLMEGMDVTFGLDYKDQTNSNGYIEFPALVRNVPYKWCKAEDPSNVYADADSLTVWVSLT